MTEATGFESAPPAVQQAEAAVETAKANLEQAEKAWHDGMTPAERTAAEVAESTRLAAARANGTTPVPPEAQPTPPPVDELVESEAARINREMHQRILAARAQAAAAAVPKPPQPVAPAIMAQTQREMAEGARISAKFAEQQRLNPRKPPTAAEIAAGGTTTPVFRPQDFIPKQG